MHGTPFQKKVWEALTDIPIGQTSTYKEIAAKVGGTAQEVGEACATNKIALIVPCHRVVRSDDTLAGYRWGGAPKALPSAKGTGGLSGALSRFSMPLR